MLGIADSLFVLIVALLGLQFMSASTFGFEEIEFKHLLPRIGLAFLGANVSLFLADYAIQASNALVSGVISATGGLNHAWISNAVTISSITNGTAPFIILIFLLIFLIVAIVLLLMYISRLIIISLGVRSFPVYLFTLDTTQNFRLCWDGNQRIFCLGIYHLCPCRNYPTSRIFFGSSRTN